MLAQNFLRICTTENAQGPTAAMWLSKGKILSILRNSKFKSKLIKKSFQAKIRLSSFLKSRQAK